MEPQPFNQFGSEDPDKSNDSSFTEDGAANVIWANTQSPGNGVLARMMNEAYDDKRKRQSRRRRSSISSFMNIDSNFNPLAGSSSSSTTASSSTSNWGQSVSATSLSSHTSASSSGTSARGRTGRSRRCQSSRSRLEYPGDEEEEDYSKYANLDPALREKGSTQFARDELADFIKGVRVGMDDGMRENKGDSGLYGGTMTQPDMPSTQQEQQTFLSSPEEPEEQPLPQREATPAVLSREPSFNFPPASPNTPGQISRAETWSGGQELRTDAPPPLKPSAGISRHSSWNELAFISAAQVGNVPDPTISQAFRAFEVKQEVKTIPSKDLNTSTTSGQTGSTAPPPLLQSTPPEPAEETSQLPTTSQHHATTTNALIDSNSSSSLASLSRTTSATSPAPSAPSTFKRKNTVPPNNPPSTDLDNSKMPIRRSLGMRQHRSLPDHGSRKSVRRTSSGSSTSAASASGSGSNVGSSNPTRTTFRPPLTSSKVVPNLQITTAQRQIIYPKGDIDPPTTQAVRDIWNGKTGTSIVNPPSSRAGSGSSSSSKVVPGSFTSVRNQPPSTTSSSQPTTTRKYQDPTVITAVDSTMDVSGFNFEFTPPEPFTETDDIGIIEPLLPIGGDLDDESREKQEEEPMSASGAIQYTEKCDSSFGPMDIDFDELERVCSMYD